MKRKTLGKIGIVGGVLSSALGFGMMQRSNEIISEQDKTYNAPSKLEKTRFYKTAERNNLLGQEIFLSGLLAAGLGCVLKERKR